ncbi:hypothetical protein HPG69_010865, partial [Diceros bicornis minor]
PDVEADQQELTLLKTVDEPGDGLAVKEEILPSLEPIKMPETGSYKHILYSEYYFTSKH